MGFQEYLIRRLLATVVTLWGILTLVFLIGRVLPGDPAAAIAGQQATEEQLEAIRAQYGLDKPLVEQYVDFFRDLVLYQDLGLSVATQRPVSLEILIRFPATFELTTLEILIAIAVGIPLGIVSAMYKDDLPDHASRTLAIGGISLPAFWIAILAQLLFYFYLGLFPSGGRLPDGLDAPPWATGMYTVDSLLAGQFDVFLGALYHLTLPAAVLALAPLAQTTRIMRSSMIETINADYIEWSRAHGFPPVTVMLRHALRNAIMPTITAVGLTYGLLLGGSVVVEIVFNYPGMGLFLYNAVLRSDFNGILGVTVVFALAYLLVNLAVDLLHTYVNPEVEASG